MTEQERQTAERLCNSSDFIKAANSFANYAHKEWVQGNADQRAMLMCCVDRTIPEGVGSIGVAVGDGDLIAAALMNMQDDDAMGRILRKAHRTKDVIEDYDTLYQSTRSRLRVDYWLAAFCILWTLCIIFFQVLGIANWITTISNLLMMAVISHMLWREITERRRMMKRLVDAVHREREERMNMLEQKLQSFMDMLKSRLSHDDDDEDDD